MHPNLSSIFSLEANIHFKRCLLNSNNLFSHQKHCLYILRVIWDKLESCLVYPPIFICELQPIKTHHNCFCAHNLMYTFSLADETVVLYLKVNLDLNKINMINEHEN